VIGLPITPIAAQTSRSRQSGPSTAARRSGSGIWSASLGRPDFQLRYCV